MAHCNLRLAFWHYWQEKMGGMTVDSIESSGEEKRPKSPFKVPASYAASAKDIYHELKHNKGMADAYLMRAYSERSDEKIKEVSSNLCPSLSLF